MNWDDAKILGKEHNKEAWEEYEAIEIRRRGATTLNRDEGTYLLSHIYDPLIKRIFAAWERNQVLLKVELPSKVDQTVILKKPPKVVRWNIITESSTLFWAINYSE